MDNCGFYSCHTVRKMSAEIEELEEQIEKMKNCMNCQNCGLTEDNVLECFAEHEINTYACESWELAE